MKNIISVSTAKALVKQHVPLMPAGQVKLEAADGLTLAEDIKAPLALPPFDQSAMDGYAFRFADWNGSPMKIEGEQAAGTAAVNTLVTGTAMRIFTGAALPAGADTVVMQEKTSRDNGLLTITDEQLVEGTNVRKVGSEVDKDVVAIGKGTTLLPAALGLLASMGITDVPVYKRPQVSLLITGNELQTPGIPLVHGQVYESNSYTLRAALQRAGINDINIIPVKDDPDQVESAIRSAIGSSDLVLLTGGVSVGDYDYVVGAAGQAGIETIFHKIRQRPGKPLFYGRHSKGIVFGLPGNPGSVLTCFYEYVYPAICAMMGKDFEQPVITAVLQRAYSKPADLTCFVKAGYDGKSGVMPLDAQESFRLRSFAVANALIKLEEGKTEYLAGEHVEVHPIPM